MCRAADWSLLGGTDPAPGNVEDVQRASTAWAGNAARLADAQNSLTQTVMAGEGAAVSAVRMLLERDAEMIGVYRVACEDNARAFHRWAASLAGFQVEADRLHFQAMQAHDDEEAGRRLIEAGKEERIHAAQQRSLLEGIAQSAAEIMAPAIMEIFSDSRGEAMVQEASERLDALRRQAEELRSRYDAEGRHVAGSLHIPAGPVTKQSFLGIKDSSDGSGSFAALLALANEARYTTLNTLYDKATQGDAAAGQEYLALLAQLTPADLVIYGMTNPDRARNPLARANDTAHVKSWWGGLAPDTRALLTATVPGIIGNLNGIPYSVRNTANRQLIQILTTNPPADEATRNAVEGINNSLSHDDGSPLTDRFLVSFDLNRGKPLAAVAIGDLDTAGNVTWNIPGMGTTVAPGGIDTWTEGAQAVYDEQRGLFRQFGPAGTANAVVSWVGYETPGMVQDYNMEVFAGDKAWAGSDKLAATLDGFHVTRDLGNGEGVPKVNVLAHSYGTTTAAYALTKTMQNVDTVTFFGSAGIDPSVVPGASALHVAPGADGTPAVYATQASRDLLAPAGITGSAVGGVGAAGWDWLTDLGAGPRFIDTISGHQPQQIRVAPTLSGLWPGAHVFSSEGGIDPESGEILENTDGHQATGAGSWGPFNASSGHGYLDPKTESLLNIGKTTTGHADLIHDSRPLTTEPIGTEQTYPELTD
ncbi:alpha/beta hydrolase [Arthrobacter alkaliphilus]|uniref:alpha/beta hydrolase n=1 Tax=Arthrobacter alkaliphilus TaxID=369936 RepID=UPI001F2647A1|nr:alpha/beta hydrolase [Arthrobacter alkaliphilus]